MAIDTSHFGAMAGEARSVQAPGLAAVRIATNGNAGAWKWVDLSAFKGQYVTIYALTQALDYCCVATGATQPSSATGTALDAGVASSLAAGGRDDFVVPDTMPFLALRSNTATAGVAIVRRS